MAGELVVIDTSAWIFALRKHPQPAVRDRVDRLLQEGNVAMVAPVRTELVGGTRSSQERDRLLRRLGGLLTIQFEEADWETAAGWMFDLRRSGVTVPTMDLLIAAPTVRTGAVLLHTDRDFDRAAPRIGLRVESLVDAVANSS